jgi:hypothetical protein
MLCCRSKVRLALRSLLQTLLTCGCCPSFDCCLLQLLYFDAASGRLLQGSCRDTVWASFSSRLGLPVMGIWPPLRCSFCPCHCLQLLCCRCKELPEFPFLLPTLYVSAVFLFTAASCSCCTLMRLVAACSKVAAVTLPGQASAARWAFP